MTRLLRIILSSAISCFASTLFASTVWLAGQNNLVLVDGATNQSATLVTDALILQLAVNADDSAWLLSRNSLTKKARGGAVQATIDLKTVGINNAGLLALDPFDGSVWLSDSGGMQIVHLNAQGQKITDWSAPDSIRAMTLGVDETIWILGNKQVWQFSPAGRQLLTIDLHPFAKTEPKMLAVDSIGLWLWFSGEKQLTRLDRRQPLNAPVTLNLPNIADFSALDTRTGTLWLAAGGTLLAIDDQGNLRKTVDLAALNIKKTAAMAFDPASRSLWLAYDKSATQFDANGQPLGTITLTESVTKIGVAAFWLVPTVAISSPANALITNNARVPLSASLGATCNGATCGFSTSYFLDYRVTAMLNNSPIAGFLTIDPATAVANYVPTSRWPEGVNALSVKGVDGFNHASPIAQSLFTIDTIPPKFTSILPASGSTTANAAILISGTTDETGTIRLVGDGVTLMTQGTSFSFPVTLKPGLNIYTLSATDVAGNVSTSTLKVSLLSLQIAITSPSAGQTINGATAIVKGTVSGTANVGVSVNGATASISGTQFVALIPVTTGLNTIVAQAVSLNDGSATDTVSVTVVNNSVPDSLQDVSVSVSSLNGLAPSNINVSVQDYKGAVSQVLIDFKGAGIYQVSAIPNLGSNTYTYQYTTPGLYTARVTLFDNSGGAPYTYTYPILIRAVSELDQQLRGVLADMSAALRRGDIETALKYFTPAAAVQYRPIIADPGTNLSGLADQLGNIVDGTLSGGFAEYLIVRQTVAGKKGYLLYFLQMPDGAWRIAQM